MANEPNFSTLTGKEIFVPPPPKPTGGVSSRRRSSSVQVVKASPIANTTDNLFSPLLESPSAVRDAFLLGQINATEATNQLNIFAKEGRLDQNISNSTTAPSSFIQQFLGNQASKFATGGIVGTGGNILNTLFDVLNPTQAQQFQQFEAAAQTKQFAQALQSVDLTTEQELLLKEKGFDISGQSTGIVGTIENSIKALTVPAIAVLAGIILINITKKR